MSQQELYASLYHGKETCSDCGLICGREKLRTCEECRMVRYCSRACQRRSWPQHKKRCNNVHDEVAQSDHPEDAKLLADFTHWKNVWSGALRYISLWALDVSNAPLNRLSTHCVLIQIEPRKNPPSKDKAFKLMGAQLVSREEFLELCKKNKPPHALVEQFKNDVRGNNTLQIILVCEFFYKLIWFGYSDLELDRARARKPEASKLGADYWEDGLKDAIEVGDPASIQTRLLEAIGRYNTLIGEIPLPPFHPPS